MSEDLSDTYEAVPPGASVALSAGLRRILAPNPSPMTSRGTNTYLVGTDGVAVIDPGPDDPVHLAAILAALAPGQRISHVLVTHAHRDHSALAPRLSALTGAPVLAFGPAGAGRDPAMAALAETSGLGGGEGVDLEFRPDRRVTDGEWIDGDGWRIEALWTPGHMSDHLCLAWRDVLFSGDLVMGWASTLISPPDGDLQRFLDSCGRLAERPEPCFLPGHGAPVTEPRERCRELIAHRRMRTAQIRDALSAGPLDLAALTACVYPDLDPALHAAAARNLLAHLMAQLASGDVRATPTLSPAASFSLAGAASDA